MDAPPSRCAWTTNCHPRLRHEQTRNLVAAVNGQAVERSSAESLLLVLRPANSTSPSRSPLSNATSGMAFPRLRARRRHPLWTINCPSSSSPRTEQTGNLIAAVNGQKPWERSSAEKPCWTFGRPESISPSLFPSIERHILVASTTLHAPRDGPLGQQAADPRLRYEQTRQASSPRSMARPWERSSAEPRQFRHLVECELFLTGPDSTGSPDPFRHQVADVAAVNGEAWNVRQPDPAPLSAGPWRPQPAVLRR